MKKILLILVALLATSSVWAEDYITDVMVIGGSKSETNALKTTYTNQGWTVIDQDLNAGCGSSSDYIYLLYKKASETGVEPGAFITDFVISTATGTIPDNLSYNNNRTYQLVPFDGSNYFKNNKGDLNSHCGSSSATIHLYFTRDYDRDGYDYSTVKSIAFNNTQAGGVTAVDDSTGYDLNTGCGSSSDYIYMHTNKAPGWELSVNTAGTQCYINGFDGPKTTFKDIIIPTTINGATVIGITNTVFSGFTNLETMTFDNNSSITQMPSLQGCSKFYNVKTNSSNNITPSSMTRIPGYAFAGTAIEKITFTSVTSVGSYVFSGCKNLSFVDFFESCVMIENSAFSNIGSSCEVSYWGDIEDWNPMMYMYSPGLVVEGPLSDIWYCGWCGGSDATSQNHLYWTLKNNHLKINCATDIWDTYPEEQHITSINWDGEQVDTLTLEHVDYISQYLFEGESYPNLTVVDVKSGLRQIKWGAFKYCDMLEKVYLPSCLDTIKEEAFGYCQLLADLYFDGTGEQWNNGVVKETNWNQGVADDFKAHWHCLVTYNANGHGTAPDPVSILWSNEDKLDEPNAPSADGYIFTGWYTEPACTNRWNFDDEIPGDMTLYAGWEKIVVNIPGDVNGDGAVTSADVTCIYNYLLNGDQTFIDTCDVNGDGAVTSADVTVIYNILLGSKN